MVSTDTLHFDLLSYCIDDKKGEPILVDELRKHLMGKGHNTIGINVLLESTGRAIDTVLFTTRSLSKHGGSEPSSVIQGYLVPTQYAYFQYSELQELKFARENAKRARSLATISIWLAIIAIAVNAFLGALPMFLKKETVPVRIEKGPFDGL